VMGIPLEIAIASRNPGKIREIKQICADWPVRWVVADEDDREWPEVDETGQTYLDNALLKAREVSRALAMPCVADDSGIEVDALDGRPGPRSARFAGNEATDEENLLLLIESIRADGVLRTARYVCVAATAWPDGREIHAEARCEGTLITQRRGSEGFGYDPVFVPLEGDGRTMAEMSPAEKDAISHRGRAFRALRDALER